jgi:L-amino acid N-acyltransferase YncA
MRVREMEHSDVSAVAAIYNEGIRGRGATFRPEEVGDDHVAAWVEQADRQPVLVCEDGGQVVGWARAGSYSGFAPYGGVGELAIYVASSARRRGVARALVDALATVCRERGHWKLIAKVFPSNEASIELLHRCGYRDVGLHLRHGQMPDGEWRDVLLMEKSL